jgi:VIT1/CCC1 family predicted Fe2+/Mn2+ transporter
MRALVLVLYILAAVLFGLAALLPEPAPYRLRFVAAGLLAAFLVPLIGLIQSLAGS